MPRRVIKRNACTWETAKKRPAQRRSVARAFHSLTCLSDVPTGTGSRHVASELLCSGIEGLSHCFALFPIRAVYEQSITACIKGCLGPDSHLWRMEHLLVSRSVTKKISKKNCSIRLLLCVSVSAWEWGQLFISIYSVYIKRDFLTISHVYLHPGTSNDNDNSTDHSVFHFLFHLPIPSLEE